MRTWTDDHGSTLWSTPDSDALSANQGIGVIARAEREHNRYREVGLYFPDSQSLMVRSRFPSHRDDVSLSFDSRPVRLEPATEPTSSVGNDLHELLTRAVRKCVEDGEFLVVELGGWDAPEEPYCLHIVMGAESGPISMVETAPPPGGSKVWDPHIAPDAPGATMTAPVTALSIQEAPTLMMEAVSRWGVEPWDIALTYARHPNPVRLTAAQRGTTSD